MKEFFMRPPIAPMAKLVVPPNPTTYVRQTLEDSRNQAKWAFERVVRLIKDFEDDLDQNHEIGATLASFGAEIVIQVLNVGYWGSDIITFEGINTNNGSRVQLIQNVAQLNLLLIALPKQEDEPRRIGFDLERKLEKDEDEEEADG